MSDNFQENITERVRQFYLDGDWPNRAQELLQKQAQHIADGNFICTPFVRSPLRDACLILAKEMKNHFETDLYQRFPDYDLWREIASTVAYYIDWPEVAICLLGDHIDELADIPHLWFDYLTADQHAILLWADNTGSLYKTKLESQTRLDNLAKGWYSWIANTYTDYRQHCAGDPDSVELDFEAMRELGYYCETRALFRS
jgi:hypothetical protein